MGAFTSYSRKSLIGFITLWLKGFWIRCRQQLWLWSFLARDNVVLVRVFVEVCFRVGRRTSHLVTPCLRSLLMDCCSKASRAHCQKSRLPFSHLAPKLLDFQLPLHCLGVAEKGKKRNKEKWGLLEWRCVDWKKERCTLKKACMLQLAAAIPLQKSQTLRMTLRFDKCYCWEFKYFIDLVLLYANCIIWNMSDIYLFLKKLVKLQFFSVIHF